jgi:hypothetical protein
VTDLLPRTLSELTAFVRLLGLDMEEDDVQTALRLSLPERQARRREQSQESCPYCRDSGVLRGHSLGQPITWPCPCIGEAAA